MRTKTIPSALFLAALAAASCSSESEDATTGGSTTAPEPQTIINIAVDANRDGKVDPEADQAGKNEWTIDVGASFLANLDDDDADQIRDADDQIINGVGDEADLAPILVSAWPEAPDGATGVFHIDPLSAANVRLWKKGLDGLWVLVGGSVGACNKADPTCVVTPDVTFSIEEVRAGLTLGIEALTFRRTLAEGAWTGSVQLGYQINDDKGAAITTDEVPTGVDQAKIQVAPWILFGNVSPFTRLWSSNLMAAFVAGLTKVSGAAGVEYSKISDSKYSDQWTQDYFQTAWTSIPAADGAVHGMKIANARPWGQCGTTKCLPYDWLKTLYLAPGAGIIETYNKPNTGSTYDSHGNHDLLPPYENGEAKFPVGRIIYGSGVLKETREFYEAQKVQGPALTVKTSWLYVGHVDEVFSYVPAKTPRGWKVIVGSPKMGRALLEAAQTAGHGAVTMFKGKKWWTGSGQSPAEVSIDAVLANPDLMAASQEGQAEIDDMVDVLKAEIGLTDADFVEVPFLFEDVSGQLLAYNPGTANILVIGDHAGVPDPFGPVIDGNDIFKKDYTDRLATPLNGLGSDGQGLKVTYVDDWIYYHALAGEVHCGSNVDADPPADQQWWKVSK